MQRSDKRGITKSLLKLLLGFFLKCPATATLVYTWWLIYLIPLLIDFIFGTSLTSQLNELCQRNVRIFTHGELWRPLTSLFIHHIIPSHIYSNAFAFIWIGLLAEKEFGSKRFFQLFFLIGVTSNFITTFIVHTQSYGASSGIAGMFHFFCIYYLAYSDREWFYYVLLIMLLDMTQDILLMQGRHIVSIGLGNYLGMFVVLWNYYVAKRQKYFLLNFDWNNFRRKKTKIYLHGPGL
jgi:membrane associated rhomboid family serine protease